MHILQNNLDPGEHEFIQWILDIGNGLMSVCQADDMVEIPRTFLLPTNSLESLINWVYKDIQRVQNFTQFFKYCVILAPKNVRVDEVNAFALNMIHGQERVYLSADIMVSSMHESLLCTFEFLNSLNLGGGYPPH